MKQWIKNLPNSTAFWLALVAVVLVCSILLPAVGWGWLRSGASEGQSHVSTESTTVSETSGAAETNSTTVRNIGFIIAGVLALVFAVWRGVLAQRQAETSEQGLLNERYQKGAEMLGSSVLSVRMGGIYALQRLAEEHPGQYHIQIMELFCAFVRFPTDDKTMDSSSRMTKEQGRRRLKLRPDVQDVVKIIGSRSQECIRLERKDRFRLYLRDADISNLQTADANLSRARLTNANLSSAILRRADLSRARLRYANLSRARLVGSNLSRANLSNAYLNDADLSCVRLAGANLTGTDLGDANLTGVSL